MFHFLTISHFRKSSSNILGFIQSSQKVQIAPKEKFSLNYWKTIKQLINLEYQRELKEVSDATLQRHSATKLNIINSLKKIQFVMFTSQIADDE